MRNSTLRYLLPAIVFLATQLIAGLLVGVAGLIFNLNPSEPILLTVTVLLSFLLAFAGCHWGLKAIRLPECFQHRAPSLLVCCIAIVAIVAGILGCNVLCEQLNLADIIEDQMIRMATNPLGMLTIGLIGPVVEELVFREATLGTMLRNGVSPWAAMITSALIFGIAHINPAQVPFAAIMGLMLAIIYYRTGNIVLTSILHIINNSVAVVQINLLGEEAKEFTLTQWLGGTTNAWLVFAFCALACLALLIVFWRKSQTPSFD